MISLYLIIQGHSYLDMIFLIFLHLLVTHLATKGHSKNLFKPRSSCRARSNFFSSRVVNEWNSLPDYVIKTHDSESRGQEEAAYATTE